MPVTAPTDKRLRRAQPKRSRRRARTRSRVGRVVFTIVAAGLTLYVAHRGAVALRELPILRVERIAVRGNERLSDHEVAALLGPIAGRSILSTDLEEARQAVLNSPWIADAVLHRTLPATIEVTIRERVPLAIARIDGQLFLVDEQGAVIDYYTPGYADIDLPIIDGISSVHGEEQTNVYRAALVQRLLEALRPRNLAGRISEIDVTDTRNAVVLVDDDPTLIRLGDVRFAERLQSYFELAAALRESVPAIDYVDLRFDGRIYVRPAKPMRTAPVPVIPRRGKRGKATQTG